MDRDRLKRIRNWQSSEFYARLVMRPLTIALMLVVADWRWLTPNLVTTLANLAKLAGAALIVGTGGAGTGHDLAAAALLQVGLLLDHLDGTIARYRQTGTAFGAFYDKVSDAVTWFVIAVAVGWRAAVATGDAWMIILAAASAYGLLALGYMKWMVVAEQRKAAGGEPPGPARTEPPERTPREWALWIGDSLLRALRFEEVDLFFWVGLLLVLDELEVLVWGLAVTQGVQLLIMLAVRARQARALDLTDS